MRVEYEARGGRTTERFRIDFPLDEIVALADLANVITGEQDALGRGLARVKKAWAVDQDGALFSGSAEADGTMDRSIETAGRRANDPGPSQGVCP